MPVESRIKRASTGSGAVVVIVVWLLHLLAGVDVPPEVAGASVVVVSTVAAWIAHKGTGTHAVAGAGQDAESTLEEQG